MKRSSLAIVASLSAAFLLASCGNGTPGTAATPAPATAPVAPAAPTAPTAPTAAPTGDAAVLAAAEPFEKLTETAFSATPTVLDATIAEVRTAAQGVRGSLAADAAGRLDEQLSAMDAARKSDNRADLAIAAVEGYRVLVSSVAPGAKVPAAVNLLDYAGFRYDADRQAKPARWDDMAQAAAFGREQWASISTDVTDAALRAKMDKALAEMASAATGRDAATATAAAQRELALVDDLETFFNAR